MNLLDCIAFNENHFPVVNERAHDYSRKVAAGYDRMRTSTVTIAGLARSIARILPATMLRIELLGATFSDYRVFIYENDSDDETPELLEAWAASNPRVNIISERHDAPVSRPIRCSNRADRMAYYRSQCQDEIRKSEFQSDAVILIDTDLEGGWSPDGVASTFGYDGWDFVGSNGVIYKRERFSANALFQYDAWAYREHDDFRPLSTKYVNQLQFQRGEALVPLQSCFGGLGIYTRAAFLAGEYHGGDIEHVSFHRSMRDRGFSRTFLNPSQFVVYGRKHRRFDRWLKRFQLFSHFVALRRRIPWRFEQAIDYRTFEPFVGSHREFQNAA